MSKRGDIPDLVGRRFGRLLVKERACQKSKFICICDCGNERIVSWQNLINCIVVSCGCYQKEIIQQMGFNNAKQNEYDLSGQYGIGYTLKGEEFFFDLEDYDLIKNYCWYKDKIQHYLYARNKPHNHLISMHRLLIETNEKQVVDHINRIRWDNRKGNLRVVDRTQNNMNKQSNPNKWGFRGIYKATSGKFCASISMYGKKIHLGSYNTPEEAYNARLEGEKTYFGEYSMIPNETSNA
jgi:hypothetical protein